MDVSVYIAEFSDTDAGGFDFQNDRFFSTLPKAVKESILRFKQSHDRMASLIGKRLLAEALMDLGINSQAIDALALDQNKRPYIAGNFDFNISHSGNIVALAISGNCRVGIDIEKMADIDVNEYSRCFTGEEWQYINDSHDARDRFYKLWAKKESILKCYGMGFLIEPNLVSVLNDGLVLEQKKYYGQEIMIKSGYAGYLATDSPIENFQLIEFNKEWL